MDAAIRRKADAVGFQLADADQWFVNSPGEPERMPYLNQPAAHLPLWYRPVAHPVLCNTCM